MITRRDLLSAILAPAPTNFPKPSEESRPSACRQHSINVCDFGAAGDGRSDDSNAFLLARERAIAAGLREVYIPPGRYRLSLPGILSCVSSAGSPVQGFTWRGAGMLVSELLFSNSDDWVVDNNNDQQFCNYIGLSFDGDASGRKSRFMRLSSHSFAQSIRFSDCRWRYWHTISHVVGTANGSELLYTACKTQNIYGPAFVVDNVQSVNHLFLGCDLEVHFDDIWQFKRGGSLSVFGGSLILSTSERVHNTGAVLNLSDRGGKGIGLNNWNFNFFGVRVELHGASCFLKGASGGIVSLYGANVSVVSGEDPKRTIFFVGDTLTLHAASCTINGAVHLGATSSSSWAAPLRPATFVADSCSLGPNFRIVRENVSNKGGVGRAILKHCRMGQEPGLSQPIDQTLGALDGTQSIAGQKRVAILRNPIRSGGLPLPGQELVLRLPAGSIVTQIRLVPSPAAKARRQIYFLTIAGKIIKSWELVPGVDAQLGDDAFIVCDDLEGRALVFVGSSGNENVSYDGFLYVEYAN